MAIPTSSTWQWVETVGDYHVWRRLAVPAYVYQVSKVGDPPPTTYAGYANKNALLRLKGVI